MLFRPFRTVRTAYRHAGRYREVATVLVRHGFGFVLDQSGLSNLAPWPLKLFRRSSPEVERVSAAQRLRLVLEALGPTTVKLGQIMSTRSDLLPPDMVRELGRLQDAAPPFPYHEVREQIITELGQPPEALFAEFDETPLAAASLAQVHAARLPSGEEVVVKVQRPGIEPRIETDLEILYNLAPVLERRFEWARMYDLVEIVDEFARTIRGELDFRMEARAAEQFRRNFADDPTVIIPRVFSTLSTRRLLTLEHLRGEKISLLRTAPRERRELVAHRFVRALLRQMLTFGLFHADPHPGNVLVEDGAVAFVDFGMIGHLSEQLRDDLVAMVLALVRQDLDGLVDGLLELGVIRRRLDRRGLKQDIARELWRYYAVPLRDIPVGESVSEAMRLAYKYHLRMPADLALLAKAVMTMEAVATDLDPHLSVVTVAEPFARDLLRERMSPQRLLNGLTRSAAQLMALSSNLPRRLNTVLTLMEQGELRLQLDGYEPDAAGSDREAAGNRLALALVVAAGTIAAVVLLQMNRGPRVADLPVLGLLTLAGTLVLLLWLVLGILRSGRF